MAARKSLSGNVHIESKVPKKTRQGDLWSTHEICSIFCKTMRRSVIVVKDDKYKRTLGSFFYIFNSIMTKLFVLPLMLATTAGIIGSTPVEILDLVVETFISSPKTLYKKESLFKNA